jgi:hypothetical protein
MILNIEPIPGQSLEFAFRESYRIGNLLSVWVSFSFNETYYIVRNDCDIETLIEINCK